MATIGSLVVDMSANSAAFAADMGKARAALATNTASMNRMLAGVDKSLGMVTKAAGTFGIALGVGALAGFVKSTMDSVGALADQAEQLGLSTDALQVYQFAASQSGIKAQEMEAAFAKLTRTIGEAADGSDTAITAFNRLGVGVLDAGGNIRSTEAITRDVADAISRIEDPARRAAAMVDLMGRGSQKMLTMLSEGGAGIDKFAAQAHKSGLVLDAAFIKRHKEASDSLDHLGKRFTIWGTQLVDNVVPHIESTRREFERLIAAYEWLERRISGAPAPAFTMKLPPLPEAGTSNPTATNEIEAAKNKAAAIQKVIDKLQFERDQLDRTALGQKFYTELQAAGIDVNHRAAETIYELVKAHQDQETTIESATQAAERHQHMIDILGRQAQRAYDETRTLLEKYTAKLDELNELLKEGMITQDTWARSVERAGEEMHEADQKLSGMKDTARDFSRVIGTAFEDAILDGEKLGDVLKALEKDLARIILRVGVTKPFEDFLTGDGKSKASGGSGDGFLGDIFDGIGSLFKGGGGTDYSSFLESMSSGNFADGGSWKVGGGGGQDSQFVSFMASPDETVTVETPGQRRSGGGSGGDTYIIDARGADEGGLARLEQFIRSVNGSIEKRAVGAVMDYKRRQPSAFAG